MFTTQAPRELNVHCTANHCKAALLLYWHGKPLHAALRLLYWHGKPLRAATLDVDALHCVVGVLARQTTARCADCCAAMRRCCTGTANHCALRRLF